jgi:hypothetical protein
MSTYRSPAAPGRSRIYEKIISDALREQQWESIAELVEDVKIRCARLRIAYAHGELHDAIAAMHARVNAAVGP